jgi:hypothetical protein
MSSPTKSVLSAADKVTVEDAQTFIAGCSAMMQDYNSGKITETQVVQGLAKWSEDAHKKKLRQALDKMISPEPVSIDPAMFRASLKRKVEEISDSPLGVDAEKGDIRVQAAQQGQIFPPTGLTHGSQTTWHKWNKLIVDDMAKQIPPKSPRVFYHPTSDVAALTYGAGILFIFPEMCTRLCEVINEKVHDPMEFSGRATLGLIRTLLGLTKFKIATARTGSPSTHEWQAALTSFKFEIGDKKTELKKFAAHIHYLKGKSFWQICEASQSDIERLASQMDSRSLEDWLWRFDDH